MTREYTCRCLRRSPKTTPFKRLACVSRAALVVTVGVRVFRRGEWWKDWVWPAPCLPVLHLSNVRPERRGSAPATTTISPGRSRSAHGLARLRGIQYMAARSAWPKMEWVYIGEPTLMSLSTALKEPRVLRCRASHALGLV